MRKYIVFFYATCFFIISCKKVEVMPLEFLDQQVKGYTVFKIQSKWVYKLSNSYIQDTNTIIKIDSSYVISDGILKSYSAHEVTMNSTYHENNILIRSEVRSGISDINIATMWFEGARTSKKCTFFSNRSVGSVYNYWFYPDNIVTYQEFLPTYTLEGETYSEVMVFESRYTGASVPFDDIRLPVKVWYAKQVGIIRKEMQNGDFWDLIHYELKQ